MERVSRKCLTRLLCIT